MDNIARQINYIDYEELRHEANLNAGDIVRIDGNLFYVTEVAY